MRNQSYIPVLVQEEISRTYDSIEFSLATGQTDYDVKANESTAFVNLKTYTTIHIRTNKELTIRLNSDSNPVITLERGRTFQLNSLIEVTNIYMTNASGDTATIKILGVKRGE